MNNNISKISINDSQSNNTSKEKIESIKQKIIINSRQLENDSFFKKNIGNRETLFYVALSSFKSLAKNETDIKLISLYLSQMKKFVELLKKVTSTNNIDQGEKNNTGDDFYDLMDNVSAHILYEYFPEKRILMRYGDEGEKFYILLNGTVAIIVPRKKSINISLNEYFRYIALLIIYKEQQILKQVIKENKNMYLIEIPGIDYFFTISNDINPLILIKNIYLNIKYKGELPFSNNKSKEMINNDKYRKKSGKKKRKSNTLKFNYKDLENEFFKVEEFLYIYLTEEELNYYYNSLIDEKYDIFEIDDNISISPENYVKRIQNYSFNVNSTKNKKLKNFNEKIRDIMNNEKKVIKLNLYEYNILVELNSGDMFGEAALSAPSLKRNATIMTLTECHFGCLNRKIYQKHIQKATETNKKNIINYICSIGIFNKFPKDIMSKKYYSSLVFKKNKKNDLIIKQKEINNNIIIIREGIYEIIFNGNMNDIYNLINIYYKKLISFDTKQDEEMHNRIIKIKDQKAKIEKIFGNEFYKNEEYKLLLIDSPSTFGLRETEEKIIIKDNTGNLTYRYISYYDLKCNSLKGEYILIDKIIFYRQIYGTEYCVQESTKMISKHFIEKIINRLLNIRLSKIYNLLLIKGFNKDNNDSHHNHQHNLSINYSNDFYDRINSLIDNCNEAKLSSNNLEEYVFNYFENKKEKNLKEKREFKNRKEKIKQNKIKKTLLKEHSDFDYTTNTNTKNLSFTRISSAINNKSKLSLYLNKDKEKEKLNLTKKDKLILIPVIKNKRSNAKLLDLKYSNNNKSKLNTPPKKNKKKYNLHSAKLNKNEQTYENILTHKFKNKKSDIIFKESLLSLEKNKKFIEKFKKIEIEDNKNNVNINTKFNIIGGKHLVDMSNIFLTKSKSVYELKSLNRQKFIKNRSNYVINITRSFFTKQKDFNRKIRLKSS